MMKFELNNPSDFRNDKFNNGIKSIFRYEIPTAEKSKLPSIDIIIKY